MYFRVYKNLYKNNYAAESTRQVIHEYRCVLLNWPTIPMTLGIGIWNEGGMHVDDQCVIAIVPG